MRLLCRIGFHDYSMREIHVTEALHDKKIFTAVIIERCECGGARIRGGGEEMPTCLIVPEQYATGGGAKITGESIGLKPIKERYKCEITKMGYIDFKGEPQDFCFECHGHGAGLEFNEDGSIYYGGYTVDELRAICEKQGGADIK